MTFDPYMCEGHALWMTLTVDKHSTSNYTITVWYDYSLNIVMMVDTMIMRGDSNFWWHDQLTGMTINPSSASHV